MLAAKVYREYPAMREVVEELDERFIIGLDPKVLTDSKLIFFKIQKAFWYYKDHFERLIKDKRAPSMPMDMFGQLLIEESQVLSKIYPHEQRASRYREWQDFLKQVPRLGAICLNPSLDKVLMIQPFGRNRQCLQFPRGKLHAGENHPTAAAREVWEECGIRIENLMVESDWFEATIDSTHHKLYVVFPVMEELVPTIQCNKEIEQILWYPLDQLPGWSKVPSDDRGFFGVAPFVNQLKSYVRKAKVGRPTERLLVQETVAPSYGSKVSKAEPAVAQAVGSVKILKRQSKADETFQEGAEDPAADRFNADTFGAGEGNSGWSFQDMLSANTKLGVTSDYSQDVFDRTYSTGPTGGPAPTSMSADGKRILQAFIDGWKHAH